MERWGRGKPGGVSGGGAQDDADRFAIALPLGVPSEVICAYTHTSLGRICVGGKSWVHMLGDGVDSGNEGMTTQICYMLCIAFM